MTLLGQTGIAGEILHRLLGPDAGQDRRAFTEQVSAGLILLASQLRRDSRPSASDPSGCLTALSRVVLDAAGPAAIDDVGGRDGDSGHGHNHRNETDGQPVENQLSVLAAALGMLAASADPAAWEAADSATAFASLAARVTGSKRPTHTDAHSTQVSRARMSGVHRY